MARPKISILRKVILNNQGHYRYYSTTYNPTNRIKTKAITFNLEPKTEYSSEGKPYPILNVQTERQLVWFIYSKFGPGEYWVQGHLKGRQGSFTFWKGVINQEGYQFYEKRSQRREINKLKRELHEAQNSGDLQEAERLKEDLEFEKEQAQSDIKDVRYGFYPHLKRSGKRGEFHSWDDEDEGLMNKSWEENIYG